MGEKLVLISRVTQVGWFYVLDNLRQNYLCNTADKSQCFSYKFQEFRYTDKPF